MHARREEGGEILVTASVAELYGTLKVLNSLLDLIEKVVLSVAITFFRTRILRCSTGSFAFRRE